jgi:AmmeMemoRadiSam system protein A
MRSAEYSVEDRREMLGIARGAIDHGLRHHRPPEVPLFNMPVPLRAIRATFVTLTHDGTLRGCVGSLEPQRPLAVDLARNAFDTAFSDPRFLPVTPDELSSLNLEISVLSPLQRLSVASEAQLLSVIRPFEDGLVLDDGRRRATFLPKVWETLRDPAAFVGELKRKAGMRGDCWPDGLQVLRYHTETFCERTVSVS